MKDVLAALCEGLWHLGFGAWGALERGTAHDVAHDVRPAPAHNVEDTLGHAPRVLVIAPHPDDELLGCGGALLQQRAMGATVGAVYLTDGSASRAQGLAADAMARQRHREATQCAELLGLAQWWWLGLPEGHWPWAEAVAQVQNCLNEFQPTCLYVPSPLDFHPEHRRCATLISAAIRSVVASATLHLYPMQVPLLPHCVNCLVDVSAWHNTLLQARAAYQTQALSLGSLMRQRRYAAAFYGQGKLMETFWALTPNAYQRLCAAFCEGSAQTAWRGLRYRPWLDPLAYWVGRAARQRAKTLA